MVKLICLQLSVLVSLKPFSNIIYNSYFKILITTEPVEFSLLGKLYISPEMDFRFLFFRFASCYKVRQFFLPIPSNTMPLDAKGEFAIILKSNNAWRKKYILWATNWLFRVFIFGPIGYKSWVREQYVKNEIFSPSSDFRRSC